MKNSEILEKAKAVIVDPINWTQKAIAMTSSGKTASSFENAVCFCSLGAVGYIAHTHPNQETSLAERYLRHVMGGSIPSFNDNHTHSEVMEMFDKAIELAKKEEAAQESRKP